jgi:hypothetical protein
MTVDELIAKIEDMDFPQHLDPDYIGSCPCFNVKLFVEGSPINIEGNCWRVSSGPQGQQDLHIWGPEHRVHDLARISALLKHKLDAQDWYGPYTIILDPPDWTLS